VVLKSWCEVRIGRTPGPSDVAEERRRPCRAQWGHDLSMGRLLEKLGPALYSPECVEVEFSEVHIQDPAWPRSYRIGARTPPERFERAG
jgi:hypothetical protein